ncbi:MAG: thioesterase family protein [Flavobacteriales bacterium]|jgi:acyl-CoA thioester hydrolase|nr:thioesterase family protein [Flavobacteriales bacterium]
MGPIPLQIRFGDVDMARHVHNAVYLHWFELARMALLEAFIPKGHDWQRMGLILARNEVDHRMPVLLTDTIEATAWCDRIGRTSFDLRYAVRRTTGDRPGICAEGRSVLVCYDYTKERPVPVPEAWRRSLEEHNAP